MKDGRCDNCKKPRSNGPPKLTAMQRWEKGELDINCWAERDRQSIVVNDLATDRTVVEWWDESVSQMFENGFFKSGFDNHGNCSREMQKSVIKYMDEVGLSAYPPPALSERPLKWLRGREAALGKELELNKDREKAIEPFSSSDEESPERTEMQELYDSQSRLGDELRELRIELSRRKTRPMASRST